MLSWRMLSSSSAAHALKATGGLQVRCCTHADCCCAAIDLPVADARAEIRLVLPTPGLPSSKTAFFSCNVLSTRKALLAVVGA